jgi:hypothetical protein
LWERLFVFALLRMLKRAADGLLGIKIPKSGFDLNLC